MPLTCYNCNEGGHRASDCTKPCYRCGGMHWYVKCEDAEERELVHLFSTFDSGQKGACALAAVFAAGLGAARWLGKGASDVASRWQGIWRKRTCFAPCSTTASPPVRRHARSRRSDRAPRSVR